MAEPTKENARLAERLASIAAALNPPAQANGHDDEAALYETPATLGHLFALNKSLVGWCNEHFRKVKRLEARIAELEAKRPVSYEGVFDPAKSYVPGMLCTDDGSMWHCDAPCTGVRPPAPSWTLAVKRGRDAKGR
jgi:hypothetical protein